jgi:putative transposase
VIAVTAGQAGDSTMLKPLLAHLAVRRVGPGRPRTRPDALLGDKAYSSRGNRATLRAKRTKTVIPQPADQIGHRLRRGSAGGRPPAFDTDAYKGRNVIERSFNDHKQWRGLATRYDKLAIV